MNHFIPFTEAEVNAPPARFESDFMVQYLASLPALENPLPVIPAKAGIQIDPAVNTVVDIGVEASSAKNKMDSAFAGMTELVEKISIKAYL